MLIMFIASIWIPMFIEKYLIFITPSFYLLICIGITNFESNGKRIISLLILATMAITLNTNMDNRRDARQLMEKFNSLKTEKSIVFIYPSDFDITFSYYYSKKIFADISKDDIRGRLRKNLASNNIFLINSENEIDTIKMANAGRVIYINANANPNQTYDNIFNALSKKIADNQAYVIPEIFKIYAFNVKDK